MWRREYLRRHFYYFQFFDVPLCVNLDKYRHI